MTLKTENKERLEKLNWKPMHVVNRSPNKWFRKRNFICQLNLVTGKLSFMRIRKLWPKDKSFEREET